MKNENIHNTNTNLTIINKSFGYSQIEFTLFYNSLECKNRCLQYKLRVNRYLNRIL